MRRKIHVPWRVRKTWRELTGPLRMLPQFVIVGAPKGGTTALYFYLRSHPQILETSWEVQYFSNQYQKGMRWYRARFPFALSAERRQLHGPNRIITGEYTPYYLLHPLAAERIARDLPEVKLIVLLRDPVARAYSHYQHEFRTKQESLSFKDAIASEKQRLNGEVDKMRRDPAYKSVSYQRHSYLTGGTYVTHLKRFYEVFDSSQILVLKSEDLFANLQATYDDALRFLNLQPHQVKNKKPMNAGAYSMLTEVDPNLAHDLYDYFRPYNEELYRYLDVNFNWEANDPLVRNHVITE